MRNPTLSFAAALLASGAVVSPALAAGYTYARIIMPGAESTAATAINDSGVVVGYYYVSPPQGGPVIYHGFQFANGALTTIDVPGASNTEIFGIANDGTIVGTYLPAGGTHTNGFIRRNGVYTFIGKDGFSTEVTAISANGEAVGDQRPFSNKFITGFTYTDHFIQGKTFTYQNIAATAINNQGLAIGYYRTDTFDLQRGFLAAPTAVTQILSPTGQATLPYDINNLGVVAGQSEDNQGFIVGNGRSEVVSYPGIAFTFLTGINDAGDASGYAFDGSHSQIGFVYHAGSFIGIAPPGSAVTTTSGINAAGQVIGGIVTESPFSSGAYLATPVP